MYLFTNRLKRMSFTFNFGDQNKRPDTERDEKKEVSDNVIDENAMHCEEITPSDTKLLDYLISNTTAISYRLTDGGNVKCLDSQQVEGIIEKNQSAESSGTCQAKRSNSDLIPNVYEGGLKVWECSVDLLEYLDSQKVEFYGKSVLELGSGAGLPGILAMIQGAEIVHFQDYNREVVESYTLPNVHINKAETLKCQCRYFSGDWSHFKNKLKSENIKYDMILTAETIYKRENYKKLSEIFKHCLLKDGIVYLAAKSNYFGVGGGVFDFIDFIKKESLFCADICHDIQEAVPRHIVKVTWNP